MKTPLANTRLVCSLLSIATLGLTAFDARAVLYTWNGDAGTTSWQDAGNWSPGGIPGSAYNDTATIDQAVTVTSSSLAFDQNPSTSNTLTVISLSNSAKLHVTGNLLVQSQSSGGSNIGRHVSVGAGSELLVSGTLSLGTAAQSTSRTASLTVNGDVTTANFQGRPATGSTGGFNINVIGGNFEVTDTFDWTTRTNGGNTTTFLSLSEGGAINIGTMSADWTDYTTQYIFFADGTGTLTFGKTNWETLDAVEALIAGDFIRKDDSVANPFYIADNGSSWTVTVVPEPHAAALAGLGGLALLLRKRRRAIW
jgi:Tfp pilus assembly protein FimT